MSHLIQMATRSGRFHLLGNLTNELFVKQLLPFPEILAVEVLTFTRRKNGFLQCYKLLAISQT